MEYKAKGTEEKLWKELFFAKLLWKDLNESVREDAY